MEHLQLLWFSEQKCNWVTTSAFLGAMAATVTVLILSGLKRLSPESIILVGVALSSLFVSATILVQYLANETQLAMVVFWAFGDVARSNWTEILLLFCMVSVCSVYLLIIRWDLNALSSGEESARGLGVPVERVRISGMIAVSLVSAMATAFHRRYRLYWTYRTTHCTTACR